MDVCVCLSGADGRVVEGSVTLFKSRPDGPPMDVVLLYSCCVVQKGERRREGGRGWPGKVPRSPAAPHKEKERKNKPTAKVPHRPGVVKGERLQKKKIICHLFFQLP
jgi:hypothetical protein